MNMIKKPSKEEIRVWLQQRRFKAAPPPDIEQIRLELGWDMASAASPSAQDPLLAQLNAN